MFGLSTTIAAKSAVVLGGAALVTVATMLPASAASAARHAGHPDAVTKTVVYQGKVVSPDGVIVRFGPTMDAQRVASYKHNTILRLSCKVFSQDVRGNRVWYKLADSTGRWVSARFVDNVGPAPTWC
jgi:hypothetical protein